MSKKEVVEHIKKSFELKNQGHYKPAIEMLYKALSMDCDNIEILAQLSHLYRLLGNLERTHYYVDKVLEHDKNHLDCLVLLKEIYLEEGNLSKAKEVAEKIYQILPNSENLAKKIKILNELKNFDEIIKIQNAGVDLSEDVLFEIARAYLSNGDTQGALDLLEQAYLKNSSNENVLFLLGQIYYKKSDYEKSKKYFFELEKINPSAEVLNYLGLFKLDENQYEKAIDLFQSAWTKNTQNPEYAYNLACTYFLRGWGEEAQNYFIKAISLAPEKADYHYSLAYLYYQQQKYDKAKMELNLIQEIEPKHRMAIVLNALINAKKGDLLGAKSQLEGIINSNPSDDFAISGLSKVYKELSQLDSAKKMIVWAIELNPTSLDYLSDLIDIEIIGNNFVRALELAEKVVELNEKYVYGHVLLAKIYLEQKDFDSLYEEAQIIIKLDSNCAQGYYYNAISLFEQGDTAFAIESLKKSISLDLNNAMLYVKMSEFYQDLNDIKQAYDWAIEASEIDDKSYQNKWLCAKLAALLRREEDATKYYSQSYRIAKFDKDLAQDYAKYLTSVGKESQAKSVLAQQ